MNSILQIKISAEFSGLRLDKAIQLILTSSEDLRLQLAVSPSVKQIKKLIEAGAVTSPIHSKLRASYKVQTGEFYSCAIATLDNLAHTNLASKKLHVGRKLNDQGVSKNTKTKVYWESVWDSAQEKLANTTVSNHKFLPFAVIYSDPYFMVVNKNAGLPTSPTIDPKRMTLFHYVLAYLAQTQMESESILSMPYLRNLHRLDKDTSGLVLFSRKASVTNSLSALFKEGQIDKRYYLVCHRPSTGPLFEFIKAQTQDCQDTGVFTFEAYMQDSRKLNSVKRPLNTVSQTQSRHQSIWTVVDRNGLYSKTDFKVLSLNKKYVYIEAYLHTGRTHQIRVHLQALKAPIVGDPIYGQDDKGAKRLYLHAHHLSFTSKFEDSVNQSYEFSSKLPQLFRTDFPELFLNFGI